MCCFGSRGSTTLCHCIILQTYLKTLHNTRRIPILPLVLLKRHTQIWQEKGFQTFLGHSRSQLCWSKIQIFLQTGFRQLLFDCDLRCNMTFKPYIPDVTVWNVKNCLACVAACRFPVVMYPVRRLPVEICYLFSIRTHQGKKVLDILPVLQLSEQ